MGMKFANIFHCNTLQNLPKFGFFGLKIHHLATLILGGANLAIQTNVLGGLY
jgi:hypothetical protein